MTRPQPLESGKPQGPLPPQSEELSLPDDDNYYYDYYDDDDLIVIIISYDEWRLISAFR